MGSIIIRNIGEEMETYEVQEFHNMITPGLRINVAFYD
jgi:hypothetical protein